MDMSRKSGRPFGFAGTDVVQGAASRWSTALLFATSWISGLVFAAYIVAFFGGVLLAGAAETT